MPPKLEVQSSSSHQGWVPHGYDTSPSSLALSVLSSSSQSELWHGSKKCIQPEKRSKISHSLLPSWANSTEVVFVAKIHSTWLEKSAYTRSKFKSLKSSSSLDQNSNRWVKEEAERGHILYQQYRSFQNAVSHLPSTTCGLPFLLRHGFEILGLGFLSWNKNI